VISVHFHSCHAPTESELQLADLCARHAADAIEGSQERQALRQSERRLRLATQTGKVGIWGLGHRGESDFVDRFAACDP
jgi:GAF domain-containing protein